MSTTPVNPGNSLIDSNIQVLTCYQRLDQAWGFKDDDYCFVTAVKVLLCIVFGAILLPWYIIDRCCLRSAPLPNGPVLITPSGGRTAPTTTTQAAIATVEEDPTTRALQRMGLALERAVCVREYLLQARLNNTEDLNALNGRRGNLEIDVIELQGFVRQNRALLQNRAFMANFSVLREVQSEVNTAIENCQRAIADSAAAATSVSTAVITTSGPASTPTPTAQTSVVSNSSSRGSSPPVATTTNATSAAAQGIGQTTAATSSSNGAPSTGGARTVANMTQQASAAATSAAVRNPTPTPSPTPPPQSSISAVASRTTASQPQHTTTNATTASTGATHALTEEQQYPRIIQLITEAIRLRENVDWQRVMSDLPMTTSTITRDMRERALAALTNADTRLAEIYREVTRLDANVNSIATISQYRGEICAAMTTGREILQAMTASQNAVAQTAIAQTAATVSNAATAATSTARTVANMTQQASAAATSAAVRNPAPAATSTAASAAATTAQGAAATTQASATSAPLVVLNVPPGSPCERVFNSLPNRSYWEGIIADLGRRKIISEAVLLIEQKKLYVALRKSGVSSQHLSGQILSALPRDRTFVVATGFGNNTTAYLHIADIS